MKELITDTVIGAGLGSFITLIGVWLSNRFQLKARKEDREYVLKSEIYMTVAERLVSSKLLLIKLHDVSQEEMGAIEAQSVETAKLTVIATNETVQAVTELSAAIAQKLLHLLPEKIPLDDLRTDIEILSSQLSGSFQKQNQMLNEMTAYNLRGDSDPRFWQKLQDNFDHYSSQINEFIEERDKKYTELHRKTKELFIKGMEASISLTELEIKAISCVRNELKMPFDENMYRKTIRDINTKMEAEFSKFLTRVSEAS